MVFSDNIIEKGGIFLRNLNVNNENTAIDVWSTASSSYGFYSVPYEHPLGVNNLYYVRYTYKFSTTNQKPTWVQFYIQGGSATLGSASQINNPTAGTEYTVSAVGRINTSYAGIPLSYGTMYNGQSSAINGVSAQVKNLMFYEVTDLYQILKAANIATTEIALKTWCDNNLEYVPRYTNYNITPLITDAVSKIHMTKGNIVATEFIETDGLDFYATSATIRQHKYFDTGSAVGIYNNSGGGTVTHTRVDAKAQNSPFWVQHPYVLKITTNGTASPYAGGFVCSHSAAANRIVVEKFIAKIPVGYSVTCHYNPQGNGASVTWISKTAGTGDWEEYTVLYKCGADGSFSSGGHIALNGSNNTSVTWYVAYCISCIITDNENLKNFTILGNVDRMKEGYYFSRQFENLNLLPNGNISKTELTMLPSGWNYDETDAAGNAKASLVQPVGAGSGTFGGLIKIRPGQKYKVSFWVKCKKDMTSFLTAIIPYLQNGTTSLAHSQVVYVANTKTQLTADLKTGDTTVKVKTSANWIDRSYGGLGFRSSSTVGYNDLGGWNPNGSSGSIQGVANSTTINLKTAYSGTTIPANTYVVERYDGSTYSYPIQKGQLPTNNEWTYVEGYFGDNSIWDGSSNSSWINLPNVCSYIKLQLNLYSNDGSVPIKYSDIRIEPVKAGGGARFEEKIQIIGGN